MTWFKRRCELCNKRTRQIHWSHDFDTSFWRCDDFDRCEDRQLVKLHLEKQGIRRGYMK